MGGSEAAATVTLLKFVCVRNELVIHNRSYGSLNKVLKARGEIDLHDKIKNLGFVSLTGNMARAFCLMTRNNNYALQHCIVLKITTESVAIPL